jgi:hypothetical protein
MKENKVKEFFDNLETKDDVFKKWGDEIRKEEEEIEKLKELYDFGFKWIARNKSGILWAFDSKPQKKLEIWDCDNVSFMCFSIDSNKDWELFKYIKWENKKPNNIKHLIRNKYKILKLERGKK